MDLIERFTQIYDKHRPELYRVFNWQRDSSDPVEASDERILVEPVEPDLRDSDANIVTSVLSDWSGVIHIPVLDIDHPMYVRESSPGKFHLIIDKTVPSNAYWKLLDALEDCGIVEPGYVSASKERGFTAVRLPWVTKGDDD